MASAAAASRFCEAPGPLAEGETAAGHPASLGGNAGAAGVGDALDEPLLDGDEAEFEDDDEEWLDVESEDGWPAELR